MDDALRSTVVGLSIAVAAGEAYYFPFQHRRAPGVEEAQGDLLLGDAPAPRPKKAKAKKNSRAGEYRGKSLSPR